MHTSRLASDRMMAVQGYKALFRGEDSTEAAAAGLRLNMMVEGVIAFLTSMGQRGGRRG